METEHAWAGRCVSAVNRNLTFGPAQTTHNGLQGEGCILCFPVTDVSDVRLSNLTEKLRLASQSQ